MRQALVACLVLWTLAGIAQARTCPPVRRLASPDGAYTARISSICDPGGSESLVDIFDRSGGQVLSDDLTSLDSSHGGWVESAAWTPDGRYFVFSTSSSGGHQPYSFPTFVMRPDVRAEYPLDPTGGKGWIADSAFRFSGPHEVQLRLGSPAGQDQAKGLDLSALAWPKK